MLEKIEMYWPIKLFRFLCKTYFAQIKKPVLNSVSDYDAESSNHNISLNDTLLLAVNIDQQKNRFSCIADLLRYRLIHSLYQ